MPTQAPAAQQVMELPPSALLEAIQTSVFRTRSCLEAFFKRCQEEIFQNPANALQLCIAAPDYVDRIVSGPDHANHLLRANGILGTCLSKAGSLRAADQTFDQSVIIENVDPMELAAFKSRWANHLHQQDWIRAHGLAMEAVEVFRQDTGLVRDDRSLATSLAGRGVIRAFGYHIGELDSAESACTDFREATGLATAKLARTQLAAITGVNSTAVWMWFAGHPTPITPQVVIRDIQRVRADLRRRKIPVSSVVDSRCRWIIGLSIFKLMGGLSPQALWNLREARDDLISAGRMFNVVELTLDMQWCLIHSGEWEEALAEHKFIQDRLELLPENWQLMVSMWEEGLRAGAMKQRVAADLFREVRGVKDVLLPTPESTDIDFTPIGW